MNHNRSPDTTRIQQHNLPSFSIDRAHALILWSGFQNGSVTLNYAVNLRLTLRSSEFVWRRPDEIRFLLYFWAPQTGVSVRNMQTITTLRRIVRYRETKSVELCSRLLQVRCDPVSDLRCRQRASVSPRMEQNTCSRTLLCSGIARSMLGIVSPRLLSAKERSGMIGSS